MEVLLVEDNPGFRRFLREEFSARFPSAIIEEAGDGEEAMEKLDVFKPRLIFMHISLPGENGFEVCQKVEENHPEVGVIILTNHDAPEYRKAAVQCGADHFFSKDDDLGNILDAAQSILKSERS